MIGWAYYRPAAVKDTVAQKHNSIRFKDMTTAAMLEYINHNSSH